MPTYLIRPKKGTTPRMAAGFSLAQPREVTAEQLQVILAALELLKIVAEYVIEEIRDARGEAEAEIVPSPATPPEAPQGDDDGKGKGGKGPRPPRSPQRYSKPPKGDGEA